MLAILDEVLSALRQEDVAALGGATTRNFAGPIQTIIPWATNLFTETLIQCVEGEFGKHFLRLLDARRHVRRRHGFHFRRRAQSGRPGRACRN